MTSRDIVLCHPVRTAIGTYGGSLKDVPAPTSVRPQPAFRTDGTPPPAARRA